MSESFTTKQVAEHNTVDNGLYIIVDSNVYKMDTFVDEHPGGAKILKRVGGKDASKQFWKVRRTITSRVHNKVEVLIQRTVPQRERTEEVWTKAEGWDGQGGGKAIGMKSAFTLFLCDVCMFHTVRLHHRLTRAILGALGCCVTVRHNTGSPGHWFINMDVTR